jgi:hypothetical protein
LLGAIRHEAPQLDANSPVFDAKAVHELNLSGERVNSLFPIYHNTTQIRHQWAAIRRALDQSLL